METLFVILLIALGALAFLGGIGSIVLIVICCIKTCGKKRSTTATTNSMLLRVTQDYTKNVYDGPIPSTTYSEESENIYDEIVNIERPKSLWGKRTSKRVPSYLEELNSFFRNVSNKPSRELNKRVRFTKTLATSKDQQPHDIPAEICVIGGSTVPKITSNSRKVTPSFDNINHYDDIVLYDDISTCRDHKKLSDSVTINEKS